VGCSCISPDVPGMLLRLSAGGAGPSELPSPPSSLSSLLVDLDRYRGGAGGSLLLVAPADCPLAEAARRRWYTVTHVPRLDAALGRYDVVLVAADAWFDLDTVARRAQRVLRPGGTLAASLPEGWGLATAAPVLWDAEYEHVLMAGGGDTVLARGRAWSPVRATLAVVVADPALSTADLDARVKAWLRAKSHGLHVRVVAVSSAAAEGVRPLARRYDPHPHVDVLVPDEPLRGRGHATRLALARCADADFVLLDDASGGDPGALVARLAPVIHGREPIALGARPHAGRPTKPGEPPRARDAISRIVNRVTGVRLSDPLAPLKVFRRDCLAGLSLTADAGAAFDAELLVKLVRKGFRPAEVPLTAGEGRASSIRRSVRVARALGRLSADPVDCLAHAERSQMTTAVAARLAA